MKQHTHLTLMIALPFAMGCWAPALALAQTQSMDSMIRAMQTPSHIDSALRRMASADLEVRIQAFYDLSGGFRANTGDMGDGVTKLLHAHPERAEKIKLALIGALEDASAIVEALEKRGKSFDENVSEYLVNSIWAVGTLRDPRAVKALLGGVGTGGMAANFLADLFPCAVDALIERSHEAPRTWKGVEFDDRPAALSILKLCLTRQALMRAYPEAVAKVQKALLAALDSPEEAIREWAAAGLSVFRKEPEVRSKLSALASSDPYVNSSERIAKGGARFPVRQAAARALATPNAADLYYVMRTADTGECRVQRGAEPPVGEPYIGPVQDAKHQMCTHYDPASKDPYLCWRVYPRNACTQ